jgi:hypothetical protein
MKSRFFYCLVIVALLIIAGTLIYYAPNAGVEQFSEDTEATRRTGFRSACPFAGRERVFSLHRV